MQDELYVFLNNQIIGTLSKDTDGGLIFEYEDNTKRLLSLSLPLGNKLYNHKECHGYFNGLLPESENARARIVEKYQIKNPNNDFAILKAIGYDCPGAVAFAQDRENNDLSEYYDLNTESISEEELEQFIKNLPQKPLGTGAKNLRLSLAGAQDKTAIVLIDNKITMPDSKTPTTHILKPEIKGLKETIENEFICMKSAQLSGIDIPKIEMRVAGKTKYFLIERYDRINKNGKIKRLHQEDFCQALNIASAYKYEIDGGVSFKSCFEILKKTSKPALNIKQFLDRMIFNYLILNNDAHGKNFSIIHQENGDIEFAPAYDILCTKVYPNLDYRMAMEIGGYYDCEGIEPVHFQKLAQEIGISYSQFKKLILQHCENLPEIILEVSNSFENTIGNRILKLVQKNCQRNIRLFKSAK